MEGLRWALLVVGILVVLGIYLYARAQGKSKHQNTQDSQQSPSRLARQRRQALTPNHSSSETLETEKILQSEPKSDLEPEIQVDVIPNIKVDTQSAESSAPSPHATERPKTRQTDQSTQPASHAQRLGEGVVSGASNVLGDVLLSQLEHLNTDGEPPVMGEVAFKNQPPYTESEVAEAEEALSLLVKKRKQARASQAMPPEQGSLFGDALDNVSASTPVSASAASSVNYVEPKKAEVEAKPKSQEKSAPQSVVSTNSTSSERVEPVLDIPTSNQSQVSSKGKEEQSLSTPSVQTSQSPKNQRVTSQAESSEAQPPLAQPVSSSVTDSPANMDEEILVLHIKSKDSIGFYGPELVDAFKDIGMKYGEGSVFHYHSGGQRIISVANMFEPGTFDLLTIKQFTTKGLTLFFQLRPQSDFELSEQVILQSAKYLAQRLKGDVLDQDRTPFTLAKEKAFKQRIQDIRSRLTS